jgi:hypothetical protein
VLFETTGPKARRYISQPDAAGIWVLCAEASEDLVNFVGMPSEAAVAAKDFWTMRVPWRELGDMQQGAFQFYVALLRNGLQLERLPERGLIESPVPGAAFRDSHWFV